MSQTVYLLAKPFAFETLDETDRLLRAYADAKGIIGPFRIIRQIHKVSGLESRSVLVVQDPLRISDDLSEFVSIVGELYRNEIDIVWADKYCSLFDTSSTHLKRLFQVLSSFPKCARSLRIRESIFRARAQGVAIGRTPLTDQDKILVIDTYEKMGRSIRATEREIRRTRGVSSISRTSISRIVATHKQRPAK